MPELWGERASRLHKKKTRSTLKPLNKRILIGAGVLASIEALRVFYGGSSVSPDISVPPAASASNYGIGGHEVIPTLCANEESPIQSLWQSSAQAAFSLPNGKEIDIYKDSNGEWYNSSHPTTDYPIEHNRLSVTIEGNNYIVIFGKPDLLCRSSNKDK